MPARRARPPPRQRGWSAAVAAITLALLSIAYLLGLWPAPTRVDVILSIPPPPQFWFVLLLVIAQVVVASLYFRERAHLRQDLSGQRSPDVEEPEAELRPHAPFPREEPETVEEVVEYSEDAAPPGVPAAEAKRDGEFSKLLQWLDVVSTQISGWANDVMESVDTAVHRKEGAESTPLVLEGAKPRGTAKIPVPKIGTWTEVRARTAIEKYLRKRPWAPASDIAMDLGMDVHLASRVTASVREESVR